MFRIIIALAATIPLLALAAPAEANTYDVYSCWAGYGTFHNPNASTVAWTRDQASAGGHFAAHEDCAVNPTNGAMTVNSAGGSTAHNGEFARLRFTAPNGLSIGQVQLWRRAWSYGTGTGSGSQRNYVRVLAAGTPISGGTDADGTIDVGVGSRGTSDTTSHGILASNFFGFNAGPASSIDYVVGCGSSSGCPTTSGLGPANIAAETDVYGSQVTIQDSKEPTVVTSDSGLFADVEASGTRPVVVSDAYDESGISKLAVYADLGTTPVGVLEYETDVNWCNWATPAPCQNVSNAEIPVDTRQLTDGDHSFVVKAFDAAGNEKASSTHYATVKNQATDVTPAPDPTPTPDPTPAPDPTSGDSAAAPQDGAGLPNGTTNGGGGVPVTSAMKLVATFDKNNRSRLNAKYGRIVVVRGTLSDGAGQRVANAQIDYSAQSTTPRARVQNLGSVRTDASGVFVLRVATKLGSRKLHFAYRPQLGGAVATSADAQLDVIAPVSLSITPRHARNKHRVTFRGRLSAGPIPRKGKIVNLQVIVDGHWHTFATVRTTKSGRFKYRYRFMRTYGLVTYRFRARSRYESAYPFAAGSSRTVAVHVTSCPIGCE